MRNNNTAAIVVVGLILVLMLVCVFGIAGGGWYLITKQTAAARRAEIQARIAMEESMRANEAAEFAKREISQKDEAIPADFEINVDENGDLSYHGEPISVDELRLRLQNAERGPAGIRVYIVTSPETPYKVVAELMRLGSENEGVEVSVSLAVQPEEEQHVLPVRLLQVEVSSQQA